MMIDEFVTKADVLFALPESVTQLKKCMDDEAGSIDDIAAIVSTDPALTVHILKIANSALYRFPNKIETISRALQVIGTRAAYDLALTYGVSYAFKDISGEYIDLDKFWEQSVSCALLAKNIAEYHNHREPERFFVTGLLHNIGELVVADLEPDKAKQCMLYSKEVLPASLQYSTLGFHYSDLSAAVLKNWSLPNAIWEPLYSVHSAESDSLNRDAQIIRLAYHLALDKVNSDIFEAYANIEDEMYTRLDMEKDDLEEALDKTNLHCVSLISLLNPSSFMLY